MVKNSSEQGLPTICFVLAAPQLGHHADMAAVAALAVRRLHTQARIVVATDEPTAQAIEQRGHALREIANDIAVYATGNHDPRASSRHLKTILRQLVQGDFLYLDSDAIAVQPLDRGWPRAGDVALARDWNKREISPYELPRLENLRTQLGWHFLPAGYLNGGVMFVRETPAACAFYEEWHRRWRQGLSLGLWQDQPSLNSTLAAEIANVAILPDRDNWMTHSLKMFRGRARIFHFWTSAPVGQIRRRTLLSDLVERFQQDGILDGEAIARATRDNFPWADGIRLKRLLASGLYFRATMTIAARLAEGFRRKLSRNAVVGAISCALNIAT